KVHNGGIYPGVRVYNEQEESLLLASMELFGPGGSLFTFPIFGNVAQEGDIVVVKFSELRYYNLLSAIRNAVDEKDNRVQAATEKEEKEKHARLIQLVKINNCQ
ncbi:MAG: hypothetical protein NUV82_01990, partial [Candidatus Komeilibacteria bacterium]|nr:hypothetical protein [Candidatus Komeilibacteria bacterium]